MTELELSVTRRSGVIIHFLKYLLAHIISCMQEYAAFSFDLNKTLLFRVSSLSVLFPFFVRLLQEMIICGWQMDWVIKTQL